MPNIAQQDYVAGLAKGLAVLESFDTERQRLNATLAAQRAGLSRAAARRHLLTLTELGYLHTDGAYYWLAPRVLRVSGAYLASARLPRALQPTLNRLAAEASGVFSAAVLDANEVVIVARAGNDAGQRLLAYGMHLGARLPAHATSTGRVLLAALPPAEFKAWLAQRGALPRLTPHTVTGIRAFKTVLAQVAEQDHCLADQEHELGVQALAVPLRNPAGQTVAALNWIAPSGVLSQPAALAAALLRLHGAAHELRPLL